jgi:hypothetical protein
MKTLPATRAITLGIFLGCLFGAAMAGAQDKINYRKLALLKWYRANPAAAFPIGSALVGMAL